MWVVKEIFFKAIGPMIWLIFIALGYTLSATGLVKAWKANKFKKIWLYIWGILVTSYFLIYGGS